MKSSASFRNLALSSSSRFFCTAASSRYFFAWAACATSVDDSSLAMVFEKVFLTLALWMSAFLILVAAYYVNKLSSGLNVRGHTFALVGSIGQIGRTNAEALLLRPIPHLLFRHFAVM